jgi:hypothetical protein
MARIRRVVVATYRVSIRHTDTPTRQKSRQALQDMRDSIVTRAFAKRGIALTPADIEERGFRLSAAREYCYGHEVIGYEYDITALIRA